MFTRTFVWCAIEARVRQQYLEFMLVFASEFRNLPAYTGCRAPVDTAEAVIGSRTSTPTQASFTSQRFFLRLEPSHPGNAFIRSHDDVLELVDHSPSAAADTAPVTATRTAVARREKVHVYTSYHRVKAGGHGDSSGATVARSAEAEPTCHTYVFPVHELIHAASADSTDSLPDEVLWWHDVQQRVLDPLLPPGWNNAAPWLHAMHSYALDSAGWQAYAESGVNANEENLRTHRDARVSRAALARAVMDANNTLTFRARVQQRFFQNACLTPGGDEVKRALARGRLEIRQLKEIAHVRKFRAMRKRYEWSTVRAPGAGTPEAVWWLGLENRDTYGYNELEAAVTTHGREDAAVKTAEEGPASSGAQ